MRCKLLALAVGVAVAALAGCGQVKDHPADAAGSDAAPGDGPADAAGCPRTLLIGGTMVEPQGWSVVMQAPASLTYGPDYVRLDTSTTPGAATSGQLLLNYPGALPPPPFRLQAVLLVERVSTHNQFDSAAAIMASYTPPFGAGNDRSQMIYLDAGSLGWADDTQAFTATVVNNTYHTVEVAVDASTAAQVKIDGVPALTRSGFLSNGAIAIGDQTNDAAIDSAIRIRSVTLLCP
jgi:hypothetical protein